MVGWLSGGEVWDDVETRAGSAVVPTVVWIWEDVESRAGSAGVSTVVCWAVREAMRALRRLMMAMRAAWSAGSIGWPFFGERWASRAEAKSLVEVVEAGD